MVAVGWACQGALLGKQLSPATLALIGKCDEYFWDQLRVAARPAVMLCLTVRVLHSGARLGLNSAGLSVCKRSAVPGCRSGSTRRRPDWLACARWCVRPLLNPAECSHSTTVSSEHHPSTRSHASCPPWRWQPELEAGRADGRAGVVSAARRGGATGLARLVHEPACNCP